MSPRAKLLLPFGGGLDRKTGSAVVDPDAMGNLQNVHLFRGRIEMRKGLERRLLSAWGTDVIGIFSLKQQGLAAFVIYDDASREVRLFIADPDLGAPSEVGVLWTMPSSIASTPVVLGVDMYDKLILAHDEAGFSARQVTRVVDVGTFAITDLTSDLDRDTVAESLKFRGVARHLNYLLGWGYGTGADANRGEVVRISLPGQPTVFVPEHYFLVGVPGDPIVGGGPAGSVFELNKAAEAHALQGYDHRTFGVVPMDANFGLLASRLAVTVGAERFRWSLQGPRVASGGESADLEMPLDLAGPDVDPLLSATEADNGFAFYDPTEGEVVFVFDYFAYVLHLKDRSRRWSYRPFAYNLASAGLIYQGSTPRLQLPDALPAAAYVDPVFDLAVVPDNYMPSFDVSWSYSEAPLAGDQVEVWVRSLYAGATPDALGGGNDLTALQWKRRTTVAATAVAATVMAMHFWTDHEIALRVLRDGAPGIGYTGSADTWPAQARITVLAGGTPALADLVDGTFERTSAADMQFAYGYAGPGLNGGHLQPQLTFFVETQVNLGAWADVSVSGNLTLPTSIPFVTADAAGSALVRTKVVGPDGDSGWITSPVAWYVGPNPPIAPNIADDVGHLGKYELSWDAPVQDGTWSVEAQAETTGAGVYGATTTSADLALFVDNVPGVCPTGLANVAGRVRTKMTAFATDDFSVYVVTGNSIPPNC